MTNDTKVKIVDIQVRYKDAVSALAQYRTALAEARRYQTELKKELKNGKITQDQYEQSMSASTVFIKQQSGAMNALSKQVHNQIKVQKEQEGSLAQLRSLLSNTTAAYDALSRTERESAKGRDLKNKINEITNELKKAEEGTQRFYRNVGNYKSATEGLDNIKVKIQNLGKQMMMALGGGSMLAFSKDVIQTTRDFQDGMARVRAVTNASQEDMKKMTDEVRKMGRETIYHATDAAQAMENLVRGGFDADEATAALSKTLQLAQSNAIGLNEASDIMIRTMRGFDMPISVEEMEHANDVLSKTASSSATNVLELGEALKNAAPFGHALKQPIEEVNAALGVLADVGVRGADAGTALRMVILGLSTSTPKQAKVFKEFGIDINQSTLEADGLTKTLQKLKASGIMEAADSANKLASVFGRRATPQVMALINNIDLLGDKLGTLQEAQGTTERMFEQSYSNVSQSFFTLSSALESFKISLGESDNEALIAPIQDLTEGIKWIEAHLPEVARFIMTLIASISFWKLIQGAQSAFTTIRNSAVSNAEAATNTVKTLQQQEIALRKTTAAQESALANASGTERTMLEAKVLANKRQIVETEKALVKAKTAEIQMWERAAAVNSGVSWKSAMAAASLAVQGFVTASKVALKGFVFTAVIMLAFEALQKMFGLIDTSSGSTFGKITSAVTGFIKKGLNMLINAFNSVVNWIKNFVENSRIMQVWLISIKTQLSVLGAVFKTVWTVFKTGIKQIWNAFKGLIGIIGAVATALEGLLTFNWKQVKRGIIQIKDTVIDFAKDTVSNFKGAGEEVVDNAKEVVDDVKGAINDAASSKAFGGPGTDAAKEPASQPTSKPKAKPKPAATKETENSDENGSGSGSGSGDKGSKGDKEANRIKKQAELENKAIAEAEQALLDLMEDTAQKRRMQLEKQYNDEIRKLKVRLATEKNLTETAKEAIRQTIISKEQKLAMELEKLQDEEMKRDVQNRIKLIESRLSIIRKGTEAELRLHKEKNAQQLILDEQALKEEERAAKADAQQRLDATIAQYGMESEQAAAARLHQLEIETDFLDRRDNLREESRRKDIELEQKYQTELMNLRQQAMQNEIMELEIQNTNRQLMEQEDAELYLMQQEGIQMLGLEVVTQGEMDILGMRQQAAEQKYNDIVAQGQLEGETVEAFEQRKLQAEQAHANAKVSLRQAELKNEKAYYNSSKAITNSLISLTSVLGESDEGFAQFSKMITLAQIAIDTGKALSGGIASASSLPYPANLAAIATTVATVLANIATAISTVKSAKFAEGGKVEGPGTGTSDSIPARLSNGEYVMTARATRLFEPLLAAMNGVGAGVVPMSATNAYRDYNMPTEELADRFKEAVNEIHPIVSVEEITDTQTRVKVIESLDNY